MTLQNSNDRALIRGEGRAAVRALGRAVGRALGRVEWMIDPPKRTMHMYMKYI